MQAITRPFNYAIVDEVDSLLIDDCRNPMLISGPSTSNLNRFAVAKLVRFPPPTPCPDTQQLKHMLCSCMADFSM